MVRGFPIVSSTKHNLNTQSSTETEILAVDDCMPDILWTRYWLNAQGYDIFEKIIYQDNKSDILWKRMVRIQSVSAQSTQTSDTIL